MIAWVIAKTLLKPYLSAAVSFIIKHWRVVLLIAVICTAVYYKKAYDGLVEDLAAFKQEIAELTAKTQSENEKKLIVAENAIKTANVKAESDMARLTLDRDSDVKKLKELYENSQSTLNRDRRNFNTRLLNAKTEYRGVGLPNTASDTGPSAGEESIFDSAAYRTLERACQIETIDYNELRAWADSACKHVGCK
jgi:hypothetical protein